MITQRGSRKGGKRWRAGDNSGGGEAGQGVERAAPRRSATLARLFLPPWPPLRQVLLFLTLASAHCVDSHRTFTGLTVQHRRP